MVKLKGRKVVCALPPHHIVATFKNDVEMKNLFNPENFDWAEGQEPSVNSSNLLPCSKCGAKWWEEYSEGARSIKLWQD